MSALPTTPLQGDSTAAVAFLKGWTAGWSGPLVLAASFVDAEGAKGKFSGSNFPQPVNWPAVERWIESGQGKANLYFGVNEPLETYVANKKLERTDIARVRALHVDVDVKAGEDQEAGIARIKKTFESYKLAPSTVIISGGGVQAYWRLQEPIEIGGDLAKAEAAKLYNIQIEKDLAGDNCHNVDRIMRIPSTINLPNAVKIKKGRKPALSRVDHDNDNVVYDIGAFTKAKPVEKATRAAVQPEKAREETPFVGDLDQALAKLSPDYRDLLINGVHGTYGARHDGDRSKGELDFVCQCIREEIPDSAISAALLDPRYRVGECVRDKKNVERELNRVLTRGHDRAIDPDLEMMNAEHCVVRHGSKTRVVTEEDDDLYEGRKQFVYQTPEDFAAFHSNRRKQWDTGKKDDDGKPVIAKVPLGTWWWKQPRRRQYSGMIYAPGTSAEVVKGKRNLWTGFTCDPQEGDKHRGYLDHLLSNVCQGNNQHYDYLINWEARAVQYPALRGEVAVALLGKKGTGKTFVFDEFGALYGQHYLTVTQKDHFGGKFNQHLQYCSLVLADECLDVRDRQDEQVVKGLITGQHIFIEPKGVNPYPVQNFLHVGLASNNKHAVPATDDERRWFVLNIGEARRMDFTYFKQIREDMKAGGRANLLHELLKIDLTNFEVRDVPITDALRGQQALTRKGVDLLVEDICQDGRVPFSHDSKPHVAITSGQEEGFGFDNFIRTKAPIDLRQLGPGAVKNILRREWGTSHWHGRVMGGKTRDGVAFPPLADLRAAFIAKHGPTDWRSSRTEWEASNDGVPF